MSVFNNPTKVLITLNRTIAINLGGKTGCAVARMTAFTGQFVRRDGEQITYTIQEIHLPERFKVDPPVYVNFYDKAIISEQDIRETTP